MGHPLEDHYEAAWALAGHPTKPMETRICMGLDIMGVPLNALSPRRWMHPRRQLAPAMVAGTPHRHRPLSVAPISEHQGGRTSGTRPKASSYPTAMGK